MVCSIVMYWLIVLILLKWYECYRVTVLAIIYKNTSCFNCLIYKYCYLINNKLAYFEAIDI